MTLQCTNPGRLGRWVLIVLLGMSTGACRGVRPDAQDDASSAGMRAHAARMLTMAQSPELEGRETGLRGGVRTAAWVAGVLSDTGLQPIMESEYRWLYPLRKQVLVRADLRLVFPDSLRFVQGVAWVLDRGTGEGRVRRPVSGGPVVQDGGLAMDTAAVEPGPYTGSDGPIRIALLPSALRRFPSTSGIVDVDVQMEEQRLTGMVVGGFLPGARPGARDSLDIVMARMDGTGIQGSLSWTDGSDPAAGLVSLLIAASSAAERQSLTRSLPRTTLFLAVSGVEEACQGVDWVRKHVPWDRNRIRSVVLVGMDSTCFPDGSPRVIGRDHALLPRAMRPRAALFADDRMDAVLDSIQAWHDTVLTHLADTP